MSDTLRDLRAQKQAEAIENEEAYIAELVTLGEKKLSKHLDIVRMQIATAAARQDHSAVELLRCYEWQIIQARLQLC